MQRGTPELRCTIIIITRTGALRWLIGPHRHMLLRAQSLQHNEARGNHQGVHKLPSIMYSTRNILTPLFQHCFNNAGTDSVPTGMQQALASTAVHLT